MPRVTFSSSTTGFEVRDTRDGITRSIAVQRRGAELALTLARVSPPHEQTPDKRSTRSEFSFALDDLTPEERARMRALLTLPGDVDTAAEPASAIPKGFIEQPHSHPHRAMSNSAHPPIVGGRGTVHRGDA